MLYPLLEEGYTYNLRLICNFGVLTPYKFYPHALRLKSILLPPWEEPVLYVRFLYLANMLGYFR